ncbi:MAG TPA: YhbY family RNA-binding protein [Syntrophales bacterium]|nr:YhbY family RNA-binding protein [Syntrophales bacterium]HOX93475.1 YhbY family RNA-binding protein [Syntrophales bacterium]HPI57555.1 YhbY family RNA-binding protein [Syntrophales bacterium]HPN24712.1 YhbY family RNA-binding protein [Syntrophales bacterium]HQM29843.1 YhbY family RNA-binding protein [Syntrophales bacterium]
MGLKGSEKKHLRGLAHGLKPLVQVGKKGLTDELVASVDLSLADHELVKVRFLEFREEKKALSETIAARTGSELAGLIGNVAVFFRSNPDPAKRRIKLR